MIHLPDAHGMDDATGLNTIPVEDIGIVVLDHRQITVTHGLLERLVCSIVDDGEDFTELGRSVKARLLGIPTLDVVMAGERNPLMIAVGQTTASLAKCYGGTARRIDYPTLT